MPKFEIWRYSDPNDTFEVEGHDIEDAAIRALNDLGWCISDSIDESDETDEND